MVRIIDYRERENAEGEQFFALIIGGGVELVKSSNTGKYYATMKKASIPSTFDETTCKSIIGKELAGKVQKMSCEPYDYTTESGDVISLDFTYEYVEEESNLLENALSDVFSD